MSDIEFGNNLTAGTSVKSEKERTQYGALGNSEKENYRLRETITYERYDLNKTVPSRPNQSCKQSYKRE